MKKIPSPAAAQKPDVKYHGVTDEQIAIRVYELFVACGQGDGQDLDAWLTAEHELRARTLIGDPARAKDRR